MPSPWSTLWAARNHEVSPTLQRLTAWCGRPDDARRPPGSTPPHARSGRRAPRAQPRGPDLRPARAADLHRRASIPVSTVPEKSYRFIVTVSPFLCPKAADGAVDHLQSAIAVINGVDCRKRSIIRERRVGEHSGASLVVDSAEQISRERRVVDCGRASFVEDAITMIVGERRVVQGEIATIGNAVIYIVRERRVVEPGHVKFSLHRCSWKGQYFEQTKFQLSGHASS